MVVYTVTFTPSFLGELCGFSLRTLRLKGFALSWPVGDASPRYSLSQQLFYIFKFVAEQVHLAGQALDFRFCSAVYVVVQLAAQAVFFVLAVLAHHDDWRL